MSILIKKKERIDTERLTLKPYSGADAPYIAALLTDEFITRTFMVPEFESEEQLYELVGKLIAFSSIEDTVHFEYGIYLEGRLIGFLNDCGIEGDEVEIGYVISPDYMGHGYATEAVKAAIAELFSMGFKTVKAGFFEGNEASRRVMEKCGMHCTDEVDEEVYRGKTFTCRYCEISAAT